MAQDKIKVRFAPSPTGRLHIGTVRTALFNYLFAKANQGNFLLRIEDTDQKRSKKEYEEEIKAGLEWLGLDWDKEIVYQSQRIKKGIYQKYLDQLIEQGFVYPCYCTPEELAKERKTQLERGIAPMYSGKCRNLKTKPKGPASYRLDVAKVAKVKNLGKELKFNDLIRGKIKAEIAGLGDFILVKQDQTPLYQFAVVIDDNEMAISHVIRGEDHISNTFIQLLLYAAFDWQAPKFAHLPLILNEDRSKLSKRKNNLVSISDFKDQGYLPEALINYMALLGWHPKQKDDEIFNIKQAIKEFKIDNVNPSGAIFEFIKLDYLNGWYIRQKTDQEILKLLKDLKLIETSKKDSGLVLKIISLIKNRMKKLSEFNELTNYFFIEPKYKSKLLVFKKSTKENTLKGLELAKQALEKTKDNGWEKPEQLNVILEQVVKSSKLTNGDIFWSIRVALSGKEASPSPGELLWALGKPESIKRIEKAIKKLS